jgi:hypothetical protein
MRPALWPRRCIHTCCTFKCEAGPHTWRDAAVTSCVGHSSGTPQSPAAAAAAAASERRMPSFSSHTLRMLPALPSDLYSVTRHGGKCGVHRISPILPPGDAADTRDFHLFPSSPKDCSCHMTSTHPTHLRSNWPCGAHTADVVALVCMAPNQRPGHQAAQRAPGYQRYSLPPARPVHAQRRVAC